MAFLKSRSTTSNPVPAPPAARPSEVDLLTRLRRGDETAFRALVAEHGPWMLRLARRRAPTEAVAQEIVQESWLAVLQGLDRFEGRSSLRTWLYSIVSHIGTAQFHKEIRSIPFSAFETELSGPSVPSERFRPPGTEAAGGWLAPPAPWDEAPEQFVTSREAQAMLAAAIDDLPPAQREVLTLRDVEGWSSDEVCNALGITGTNQRVLLHRARSRVRLAIEGYLTSGESR